MSGKWDDDQEVQELRDQISGAQNRIHRASEVLDLIRIEADDLEEEMDRLRQRQTDVNARKEGLEQEIAAAKSEIERYEKNILVVKIMNTGLMRHQSRGVRRWRSQIIAGRWSDELVAEELDEHLSPGSAALATSSSVPSEWKWSALLIYLILSRYARCCVELYYLEIPSSSCPWFKPPQGPIPIFQ